LFNAIPISRLLQLYHDGIFTRSEISLRALVTLGTIPVAEHFPSLPKDWQQLIIEAVRTAPTTEIGWDGFMIIGSYCGTEKSAEEFEADARAEVLQYRTGVEAVRVFLDGNTS
jgi:hypothetical protein